MAMMGRTCSELRSEAWAGHPTSEVASNSDPTEGKTASSSPEDEMHEHRWCPPPWNSQVEVDKDRRKKRRVGSQKPWEDSVSRMNYSKNC